MQDWQVAVKSDDPDSLATTDSAETSLLAWFKTHESQHWSSIRSYDQLCTCWIWCVMASAKKWICTHYTSSSEWSPVSRTPATILCWDRWNGVQSDVKSCWKLQERHEFVKVKQIHSGQIPWMITNNGRKAIQLIRMTRASLGQVSITPLFQRLCSGFLSWNALNFWPLCCNLHADYTTVSLHVFFEDVASQRWNLSPSDLKISDSHSSKS